MKNVVVIKKDGTTQDFNPEKIKKAITKSADRVLIDLSEEQKDEIVNIVKKHIDEKNLSEISIYTMHNLVEGALDDVSPEVAKSYRDYRDYKTTFVNMLDKVYRKSQSIMYIGDKENANSDSALVSTKRSLIFNQLNKELYQKFFLNREEQQAINDGYIYIHDMSARRDTMNCCLFRMGEVLKGGFEMGNVWYNEPKTLDTACDVISDVILNAASQQYGGFTVPEIDKILKPYAEKSLNLHKEEYLSVFKDSEQPVTDEILKKAEKYAWDKTVREMEQGYQGWEYKLNTVASSRGDYPFTAISFGLGTDPIEKMISKAILRVHREGQGKKGNKIPVLFPKLIFLYTKDLHGIGAENEDVFEEAVKTSAKTMYPDYTSLDSDDTIGEMWHKYHKAISPMGCRAYLSPWYEKGGMYPADDKDVPVFEGRFNIGAVSLHLPMILAKARKESRDFYEVLDYYMELIRKLHIRTYAYLGEMRASTNPLAYCEGGFYGGNLKPSDKIKPLLKSATASFGITALNELQELYNGKSLVEDGEFALEVMRHIQDKVNEYKAADGNLYAIYGTPAENLCGLQIKQFRAKYGIVDGVSDRPYVSNSFHCHVSEDITPIQKQDLEKRFWSYFQGGRIQYVKYPVNYNVTAIKSLIRRAMNLGFYEGVNMALSYCNDCGHEELDMDVCPVCGSRNLTKIDRMNGYLAYSRVHGDTRLNEAKMAEIADRKSM